MPFLLFPDDEKLLVHHLVADLGARWCGGEGDRVPGTAEPLPSPPRLPETRVVDRRWRALAVDGLAARGRGLRFSC
jgi:hypothetical protein